MIVRTAILKMRMNLQESSHQKVRFSRGCVMMLTCLFLVEDTKECLKARHILGILGFLGFANVYAMRVNLSVAIVAMVNSTTNPIANASTFDHCPVPNITNSTEPIVSIYILEFCHLNVVYSSEKMN